ncbi:MAG: hypothetical protein R2939_08265 [Kofleriaceae bacterium]
MQTPSSLVAAAVALAAAATIAAPVAHARTFAAPPPPVAPPAAAPIATRPAPVARPVDRAKLAAALTAQRQANLGRFRAYVAGGVYPSNTFAAGLRNVWRDDAGHFCAAASIIAASGQGDLVLAQADRDNFVRLRDVTAGPLRDWILTSGFTVDEVDQIQRPFMPVSAEVPEDPFAAPPRPVDPALRAAEDRRLRKLYKKIDRALVRHEAASLRAAVERLMAEPNLAVAAFGPGVLGG